MVLLYLLKHSSNNLYRPRTLDDTVYLRT